MHRFQKTIFAVWVLTTLAVFFVFTKHSFIRPVDDVKELILYSSCFLLTLIWILGKKKTSEPCLEFNLLHILVFSYLLHGFILSFFALVPVNEAWIHLGRIFLLVAVVTVISRLEEKYFVRLFKSWLFVVPVVIYLTAELSGRNVITLFSSPQIFTRPLGHISYFADTLLLMIPAIFYFLAYPKAKVFYKILASLVLTFALINLLFSGRRAPFVGLILITTLFFIPYAKQTIKTRLNTLSTVLCALFFIAIYQFSTSNKGPVAHPLENQMAQARTTHLIQDIY